MVYRRTILRRRVQDKPKKYGRKEEPMYSVLSHRLANSRAALQATFDNCSDLVYREIAMASGPSLLIVYIDGLVDTKILDQVVLQPLIFTGVPQGVGRLRNIHEMLSRQLVAVSQTEVVQTLEEVVHGIIKGSTAILSDGSKEALLISVQGFEKRAIEEPKSEAVLRGPRQGFTESLRVNTALLRRIIANPDLKMESSTVGDLTQTDLVIVYIEGVADGSVVQEVRRRIRNSSIQSVLASGYIEEYIQDSTWSPFPQVQNTERPDVAASSLIEGRVIIVCDGSPFVLIVPMTFWGGLQAADDHYERWEYAVLRRWVRYAMTFVSLTLPSIYVALTTYNPQLLPDRLMASIATARELSPFPTVIETTMMEIIFEGLQEAGVRLPGQMGPLVSIVGALVVGEAAVRANLVSAPIVIVVAMTGIASYAIPRYSFGIPFRMLRFVLLILAALFGVYGLSIGLAAILIHLVTLESFGTPFFTPVAPVVLFHLRDVVIRTPRWKNNWLQRGRRGSDGA
ncbi:spore germination protein [Alicyclobacillus sp. ALC3]|uniref:spore germination protein n=1 Tax=Alicyclobacillus sp. ALC3 TaxID=2796143 RepID=UPI0023780CC1|nr:spore germination protein [Alicyclobacillus sp. ALC3]WDL98388.1 spore germination protein [Alicyclobacillus sp. ALC3]